jgi:hypothetical protein
MEGYFYSREKLEFLDDVRHKVVHSVGPTSQLPNADQDLEFLRKTSYFLFGLVNERHGVKIDATYATLPLSRGRVK